MGMFTHTHTHIVFLDQTVHNSNAKEGLTIPGEFSILFDLKNCIFNIEYLLQNILIGERG